MKYVDSKSSYSRYRLLEHPVLCCKISPVLCCSGLDGIGQNDGFAGSQLPDCPPKSGGLVLKEGKATLVVSFAFDDY